MFSVFVNEVAKVATLGGYTTLLEAINAAKALGLESFVIKDIKGKSIYWI